LCASRAQAEQVKERLAGWLEPRGLAFNEAKTRIVHLSQGFDFLGFSIRRYPNGKLLTKPSKEAMRRIRERLSAEATALRGANADAVIARLNPIITGWAAYYRIGVSKRAYNALDAHLRRLAWKWARFSHPNKPKRWIITRYFGMFNPARQDKWVFGSRDTGFYLRKFAWTKIVRHRMAAGRASPDDPALTGYWQQRRRRDRLPVDPATWHLLRRQRGRCPLCRGLLLHADLQPQSPEEWQQWHTATRKAIRKHAIDSVTDLGTPDERVAHHLIHAHCRTRLGDGTSPALLPGLQAFRACLSRAARKRARPVLRGPRRGNAPGLPDEIFFSVIQKKVVSPNDFPSLEILSETLLAFIDRYNQAAGPFNWKYTADDLKDLLRRITEHEKQDTMRQYGLVTAA
jgi:RNA-directed DNA polymerase